MSELLGSDAMGFIGFDSVSSGLHGNSADSIDGGGKIEDLLVGGSGSAFQVVMKQLGKRDPTTKLKVVIRTHTYAHTHTHTHGHTHAHTHTHTHRLCRSSQCCVDRKRLMRYWQSYMSGPSCTTN